MTDDASTARAPRRWLLVVLACLAIGGLAFAIGRFSAFGTSATTPATDSAEAGFARDMQVHHAQAVEMAMQIFRTTEDTELRTLAYDIATGQSAQRGEMFDWLVQWGLPQAGEPLMSWMADADGGHSGHGGTGSEPLSEAELSAGMGMATDAQLAQLRTASGTEADCLFLELMIRHHEGAIPMAEAILQRGSVPRVLTVATSMKNGQTAEIDAMQSIQRRLGCTG
ncbi:DUF305 domain-containing protein [Microbacterium sp. zg.B48]|uniref:DUF305 domain-containing protein n=1 Tax=Microbacterium sp. zg.B48 TaxID=2969408 RepID=UPI00214CD02B|nr:DUF305 domain-containing protein [Microbacterium sp. zg.B48]MCR2763920.1 DUF305 domain-containing protein [Microbacterium sp. zg.B48]